MAKPSSLPRWADVSGDIVEPTELKKDEGWLDGEMPPHSYFNWFQELVYQWTVYLDTFEAESHTWAAANIFNGPVILNGSVLSNGPDASTAAYRGLGFDGVADGEYGGDGGLFEGGDIQGNSAAGGIGVRASGGDALVARTAG